MFAGMHERDCQTIANNISAMFVGAAGNYCLAPVMADDGSLLGHLSLQRGSQWRFKFSAEWFGHWPRDTRRASLAVDFSEEEVTRLNLDFDRHGLTTIYKDIKMVWRRPTKVTQFEQSVWAIYSLAETGKYEIAFGNAEGTEVSFYLTTEEFDRFSVHHVASPNWGFVFFADSPEWRAFKEEYPAAKLDHDAVFIEDPVDRVMLKMLTSG